MNYAQQQAIFAKIQLLSDREMVVLGDFVSDLVKKTRENNEHRIKAIEDLKAFRSSMPTISSEELLLMRHEGHRF